jgi:hypothetical protein
MQLRRQSVAEPVTGRAGDHATHPASTIVAGIEPNAREERLGGIARRDVDEPGERVRTVERALRPAQYFHLFHVEERHRAADAAQIDAVDNQADGGIERLRELAAFADAANLQESRTRAPAREIDVRQPAENLLEMVDRASPVIVQTDDRDTGRGVEQPGLAEFAGHHDFLDRTRIGSLGRPHGRCHECRAGGNGIDQTEGVHHATSCIANECPKDGLPKQASCVAYPYAGITRIRFKGSTDESVSQVKPPLRTGRLFQKPGPRGNSQFRPPFRSGSRASPADRR